MEKLTNVEKLAKYLIFVGIIAVAFAVCWYFSTVLIYIVLAFVVSLISRPVARLMGKIRIKGKSAPDWLLSILSIILVIALLMMVILLVIPVITRIINDASLFSNINSSDANFSDTINKWIIGIFPSLGEDFDAIGTLFNYLKGMLANFDITGLIGSVGSIVIDIAIGLFAVVFISFFFVKDENLFSKIVAALVPDRIEASVTESIVDIEHLLSRYFVGLILEMFCVALLNFLGLWLIARISVSYALGIAFIAGILNILPYVGPILGEILGALLGMV
ncbi:MAG: hypothetical protein CW336_01715, partial [Bacteroidetes bacterium]|nr:hypothetical protein [Bacteroidota bacterium]